MATLVAKRLNALVRCDTPLPKHHSASSSSFNSILSQLYFPVRAHRSCTARVTRPSNRTGVGAKFLSSCFSHGSSGLIATTARLTASQGGFRRSAPPQMDQRLRPKPRKRDWPPARVFTFGLTVIKQCVTKIRFDIK